MLAEPSGHARADRTAVPIATAQACERGRAGSQIGLRGALARRRPISTVIHMARDIRRPAAARRASRFRVSTGPHRGDSIRWHGHTKPRPLRPRSERHFHEHPRPGVLLARLESFFLSRRARVRQLGHIVATRSGVPVVAIPGRHRSGHGHARHVSRGTDARRALTRSSSIARPARGPCVPII